MDSKFGESKQRMLNNYTHEHQRFLNFQQPSPKVMLSSIIKKPYFNSTISNVQSKHIFIRVDNQLRNFQGIDMLRIGLADEIQRQTYFEFSDCLNVKEILLKKQLLSIFIIPPRLLFALKQKLRSAKNVSVVIMCKDEFDVQHQLNNLYLQKITKLITCDPTQILYFFKQCIESCYSPVLSFGIDQSLCKFNYSQPRNSVINFYYPSKFQHFTKIFQTGALKRRISYPNLHFYCYNNKKDIILKDKTKSKTKKFLTRDKIQTQNYINNIESRVSISIANQIQINIIITTKDNEDYMIEYIQDRAGYEIIALSNEQQRLKFLKQFQDNFSGLVSEIQIISSQKLHIFVRYSDEDLIAYLQQISKNINIEIVEYSSLSGLSQIVYQLQVYEEQFGLIITPSDNQQMMEMMLSMKDIRNIKLIVFSFMKSHLTKSDSVYVFKKATQPQSLFQLLKQLIDHRRQYFSPIEVVKHRKITLLIDKRYTQLCQQIIIIVDNNPCVGLQIYEKQEHLFQLIGDTSSQINYLLICKEQRKQMILQYVRSYQNVKLILLSQMSNVQYHPLILQILTRHSDLLEFVSRLCRQKKESDYNLKNQYPAEETKSQEGVKYSFESLVLVPIKQKSKSIMIYSPNRDHSQQWLILEKRLRNLDERIDIFHYHKILDITKINLNQQPLSIILVTHPNIEWAANYSHQFQTGINIIAYSKKPINKQIATDSLNLISNRLQQIQQFILQAIKYYDQNKLNMLQDNEIIEATKLSLQTSMKKSVQRRTKKISARIPTQYLFPQDSLPPKSPQSKKAKQIDQNKSDSEQSQKNVISYKRQQKKSVSNLSPNFKKQSQTIFRGSLSQLGMDSRLSKINTPSNFSHQKLPQHNMVYILQHELINDPYITSQCVTTLTYSNFQQLKQIQKQLLVDKCCKIIIKLIKQSQCCNIISHPQVTIINYPFPKQQKLSKKLIVQQQVAVKFSPQKEQQFQQYKSSIISDVKIKVQSKFFQQQNKQNKLRTQSMNKNKKLEIQQGVDNDLIVKKNFFAKMFEKKLVCFMSLDNQQKLIKIINSQKVSNSRIRVKQFYNLNSICKQLPILSQQNTHIVITSNKYMLLEFYRNPNFKQLKIVFIGQQKLPTQIILNPRYLQINNLNLLQKLVKCIPRFYQVDKLSKEQVRNYQIIHFYLDSNISESFLLKILSVSISNEKCIPHKFNTVQQLKYAQYNSNQLIVLILNEQKCSNQNIQKLTNKDNIKIYSINKQIDELDRLLETINGKSIKKLKFDTKQIQTELLSLQHKRMLKPESSFESQNNQLDSSSYNIQYKAQKKIRLKQIYLQYFNQIDETAYMFEKKQILQKIPKTIQKKVFVVIPESQYEELIQLINHIPVFTFKTYTNTKSLIQNLRFKQKYIVLLNRKIIEFKQIISKYSHHVYFAYQKQQVFSNISNIYQAPDLMRFAVLLQLSIKYHNKKSKIKALSKIKSVQKISIFYKYPKDTNLKGSLQKLSSRIKCVAYQSVKGLLSQLSYLNLKDSLNIVIQRDQDILQLQKRLDLNQFKVIRLLTPSFQQQNVLQSNPSVLIEATKSSSVIECMKNLINKLFQQSQQQTIRKQSKKSKIML